MSIITPAAFVVDLTIAQTENPYMVTNVQGFIDKYEPKFLRALLGLPLYTEFVNGLIPVPVDPTTDPETFEPIPQKWIDLRDNTDLKDMITSYVYYWYKRNETTKSMGISEAKPKAENATVTNSVEKQVKSWNEMAEMARLFDLDASVYQGWVKANWFLNCYWHSRCRVSEIYYPINDKNF